jgi:hypothetical protein
MIASMASLASLSKLSEWYGFRHVTGLVGPTQLLSVRYDFCQDKGGQAGACPTKIGDSLLLKKSCINIHLE